MKNFYLVGLNRAIDFNKLLSELEVSENDIVFIGGSLVEGSINELSQGVGNRLSDLDVFILRQEEQYLATEAVYTSNIKKTFFKSIANTNCDIEVYNLNAFIGIINEIDACKCNINEKVKNMINLQNGWNLESLNELLCRFYYSICIKNEKQYQEIKRKTNFRLFLNIYKEHLTNCFDNSYEDVLGNMDSSQYETALFCMRKIYNIFLKILIINENEYIDREKWIFIKFKNIVLNRNKYSKAMNSYKDLFLSELNCEIDFSETIKTSQKIIKETLEDILFDTF